MEVDDLEDKTPKEIVNCLKKVVDGRTSVTIIAQAYLQVALNKEELIDSQREYQDESIKKMKHLVYATWFLAVVNIIAAFITR